MWWWWWWDSPYHHRRRRRPAIDSDTRSGQLGRSIVHITWLISTPCAAALDTLNQRVDGGVCWTWLLLHTNSRDSGRTTGANRFSRGFHMGSPVTPSIPMSNRLDPTCTSAAAHITSSKGEQSIPDHFVYLEYFYSNSISGVSPFAILLPSVNTPQFQRHQPPVTGTGVCQRISS